MKDDALRFGGVEFATFRLREGVDEKTLLEASENVDREFLAHEEGLLGHVLLKGPDGVYADLALADSQARAEAVCAKWTSNAVALKYIELLDETSVDMTFWERIR
ncbi:hypothetical protein CAL65_00410 [Alkalilimnicola ehrlichii]|uniref:Uncharacterized protein n=2 Tax=Alkalilimnicola ehrlichii TaxID=351052 RepID=A0A3E0X124_9GAMM|nr:hypothetical protein CAL65_00410 [Alkalilimnicola ehrlichii]